MKPEHLQYLNNKQALADIPFFAANFTRGNYSEVDLTPSGTPWVMIGGSYSGHAICIHPSFVSRYNLRLIRFLPPPWKPGST
jgi:Serine carboxypeptidase S28.